MTVLSVLMISWLRTDDKRSLTSVSAFLGAYQRMLTEIGRKIANSDSSDPLPTYSERHCGNRVRELLKNLFRFGHPFWFQLSVIHQMETLIKPESDSMTIGPWLVGVQCGSFPFYYPVVHKSTHKKVEGL
jgi:hypothetical protein